MNIGDLLKRYEPGLAEAFLAAVRQMANEAQIAQIVTALERGDTEAALRAVYLDAAAYQAFETALREAYTDGGMTTVQGLPPISNPDGGRFVIRFDVRNPRAEQWLRSRSSGQITRIVDDQRIAVRNALREGMQRGDNPRRVALDIVGRINPVSGRREGGIVGLSAPQERAVQRARDELETGDFAAYRSRKLRDKRFDRTIAKAEREGRPLTASEVVKILNRYSDRLLLFRGQTIGRTEALASLHAAQDEALRQAVDTGLISANQIRRVWDATMDPRTRFSHAVMDGQSVGLNEVFRSPNGATLRYPGDPNAPAGEVINCRCFLKVRVEFLTNVR